MNLAVSPDASPSAAKLAEKLAALSHPTRIDILRQLAERPACCCGDVVKRLDLAQSTVSQHLKVLVDAGLVTYAPDRQRSRYDIDRNAMLGLSQAVSALADACCAASLPPESKAVACG